MTEEEKSREYLLKEVDLVQEIIKRMANNSFLIKGWTITLVAATLLLRGKQIQIYISLIPLITFWFLDAYYLQQERLYRRLYDWIISNRLKTDDYLFNLDGNRFADQVHSRLRTMLSITLIIFYGLIAILILLYAIVSYYSQRGGC